MLPREEWKVTSEPEVVVIDDPKNIQYVVLCCDGVFDKKENEEVANRCNELLYKNDYNANKGKVDKKQREYACQRLLHDCLPKDTEEANEKGADNLSCTIVELHHYKL